MFIDETRTFWTNGIPITFYEIMDWYEKYCQSVPKEKRVFTDPHFDEKTCIEIAKRIVSELYSKIGQKFGYTFINNEPAPPPVNNVISAFAKDKSPDIDWFDQNVVMQQALKDLENKWKTETKKEKENIDFWNSQKHKKTEHRPAQIIKPQPQFNWRLVLGFNSSDMITEEKIKQKYRKEALKRHPDKGGSNELIQELFRARDEAYKFIGKEPP